MNFKDKVETTWKEAFCLLWDLYRSTYNMYMNQQDTQKVLWLDFIFY